MIAHLCACIWYGIGLQIERSGGESWVSKLRVHESMGNDSMQELYVRSLYWALGHLLAAPVDPSIQPASYSERVFTVCMILGSLIIIGAGISKMTNCIAELDRAKAHANDTRRKLQRVLRTSQAPWDLSSRIIRFAVHSYWRRGALSP